MDLFTYLMAKKGHNTHRDLFSYLLGKNAGGGGTYTTFTGVTLNISNSVFGAIKNFTLNSTQLTQDGTPSPSSPVDVNVIKGDNSVKITDGIEEQNYPISLASKNLFNEDLLLNASGWIKEDDYYYGRTPGIRNFFIDNPDIIDFKENTQYTLSFIGRVTETGGNNRFGFLYSDDTFDTATINDTTDTNLTVSSNINKTVVGFIWKYNNQRNIYLKNIQVEEGSTATTYEPYYNIEYCKIGDYADQIFKNTTDSPFYDNTLVDGGWYLKKNIGKIDSYNGESITTTYISTTGGLDTGATIYYGLTTSTYIYITETDYPTLYTQLNNIYNNSTSYDEVTNITQTNDDLPFNLSVDVLIKEEE